MTIVLFLDNDWQPLRVEPWTRAVTDMFLGKVEVIEYSRDRIIRAVSRELPMPAVVRVLRRFRRDRAGDPLLAREHLRARRLHLSVLRPATGDRGPDLRPRGAPLGGRHAPRWENIVTCCVPCNRAKANRTPAQAAHAPAPPAR